MDLTERDRMTGRKNSGPSFRCRKSSDIGFGISYTVIYKTDIRYGPQKINQHNKELETHHQLLYPRLRPIGPGSGPILNERVKEGFGRKGIDFHPD